MPTKPRIDIAGYHHIINRGVDRMNIFRHSEDKDAFLQIVNKTAMIHKVVVHDYCLMDNHYKARLSQKVGEYPFTLAHTIFNSKDFYPCTKESILFRDYDIESLSGFLGVEFSQEDLTFLQIEQNRKIEQKEDMIVLSKSKSLEEHFMGVESKQERNSVISLAYAEDGYSQIEIASFLGLSKSAISMIIKSDKSGD